MLSLALLALLIGAIALLGGGTMLLVASGALDPVLVTIVSLVITAVGAGALATILVRNQRQRVKRELHTIRRTQMMRERQPERYGQLMDTPEGSEDPEMQPEREQLRRDLDTEPALRRDRDLPSAETVETALDAGLLVLMVEPVVEMPGNRAVAFRARPALPGADEPLAVAAVEVLPASARTKLELWTMGVALEAAEEKLRLPVQCDVSRDLLGSAEEGIGLHAILEDFPPELLWLRAPGVELDALEAGRLADAAEAGARLAISEPSLEGMNRTSAQELAGSGVTLAAFDASTPSGPSGSAQGFSALKEAGTTLQADHIASAEQGADLGQLGFTYFTGAPFGEPRPLREAAAAHRSTEAEHETTGN